MGKRRIICFECKGTKEVYAGEGLGLVLTKPCPICGDCDEDKHIPQKCPLRDCEECSKLKARDNKEIQRMEDR